MMSRQARAAEGIVQDKHGNRSGPESLWVAAGGKAFPRRLERVRPNFQTSLGLVLITAAVSAFGAIAEVATFQSDFCDRCFNRRV